MSETSLTTSSSADQLKDKLALVSGASRGIGRAVALALAQRGVNLILVGRKRVPLNAVKTEAENLGASCFTLVCDLIETDTWRPLLDGLVAQLGSIDILVNNAGLFKAEPVSQHSAKTWNELIAVNLSATFHLCRYVAEGMIAKRWGRVVNIASVSGKLGESYGGAYSASKFGVLGLTQSFALEVAKFGVTVNAICPGWVMTDMSAEQLNDPNWCQWQHIDPRQSVEIARLSVPQERFIEASEVADLVLFLCSNQARGITGQSINICGGLSLR